MEYYQICSVPPVWRRKGGRRVRVLEPVDRSAGEANTSIERMPRDAILVPARLRIAVNECRARTVALQCTSHHIRAILL